uniref:Uncharacterized protein n=1 Tax=Chrysemys picta bellii TaxID=8478 RepID=A0A8C3HP71_CHRPI
MKSQWNQCRFWIQNTNLNMGRGFCRETGVPERALDLFMGKLMLGENSKYGVYLSVTVSAFILTIVMGMRFKRSKKLIPGGLIAGLSLLMILRLVFLLL